jgi:hypothetical protein
MEINILAMEKTQENRVSMTKRLKSGVARVFTCWIAKTIDLA